MVHNKKKLAELERVYKEKKSRLNQVLETLEELKAERDELYENLYLIENLKASVIRQENKKSKLCNKTHSDTLLDKDIDDYANKLIKAFGDTLGRE